MLMTEESVSFYSDGLRLDASLYAAETTSTEERDIVIVTCSGFQGLKKIHPERFARSLTKRGYRCFGFDYRGFGKSEGRAGEVSLEEQARDIANALAFLSEHPRARGRKMVLMGWGMGAGLILEAARIAPPVHALVAINGFYDAGRIQRQVRGGAGWSEFQSWFQQESSRLSRSGETPETDPFHVYPLDPVTEEYVDRVLRQNAGFGTPVKPGFAASLLLFAPERRLDHLRQTPILIVHAQRNQLHPPGEAQSLFEKYPGPKTLYWIPDAGHTEWMLDDDPKFRSLVECLDGWIQALA